MKQNKKTVPAELSYYGLYLLDYLRKYHPDKASDTGFIAGREEAATATFEKERLAGGTVAAARRPAPYMARTTRGVVVLPPNM